MPYRPTYDCLWCGTASSATGEDDLSGWAQVCPDCLARSGDNPFVRNRVERATAELATRRTLDVDDWLLRRGRFALGPIHDAAWNAELDAAGRWLDGLPIRGRIVELAGGTGWWSPLLAGRGELTVYEAAAEALDRARDRLVAHGLRAHLHVRDPWAEPEGPPADAVIIGFRLGGLAPDRLASFLAIARGWLHPGGHLAAIDALPGSASASASQAAPPVATWAGSSGDLAQALAAAGFGHLDVTSTGRFLLLAHARAIGGAGVGA